jgi:hypothetical protein
VSDIVTSLITMKRPCCILPPLGAQTPASRSFLIRASGTGSGFNRRIERVLNDLEQIGVGPATMHVTTAPSADALHQVRLAF